MKKSDQLKQDKQALVKKMQDLNTTIETRSEEKGVYSEEEASQFDGYQANIDGIDAAIQRALTLESFKAQESKKGDTIGAPSIHRSYKNESFSLLKSIQCLARGEQLTGINGEVNERGVAEAKSDGLLNDVDMTRHKRIFLPSDHGFQSRAAQTITESSGADGGALVSTEIRRVAPLMPSISVLENLGVQVLGGLRGDVSLPTSGLFSFDHVGETDAVNATKVSFAGPKLSPHRCAGVGAMSNQFLAQTSPDTENYLIGLLNNAYGVAVIRDFFNGSGTGAQPNGLYNLISSNVNTTAGAPTREIITNLKSLIEAENATEVSRAYVSDTELAHKMENVKVDAGSGIFLYDGGNTLRGFNYQQTTIMPTLTDGGSPANTTHPLIFGDFSQAIVGYFSNISIIVDPYTLAGSSQVRVIVEGFDDVALTNEKAFAMNKLLTV